MLGSLADVRQSLRGMGSDLVIRMSPLKEAFQDITQQCNIAEIITEEEVEHRSAPLNLLTLRLQQKHAYNTSPTSGPLDICTWRLYMHASLSSW